MWIREQTQTDRESDQQFGVALAMGFEQLRFEVMGIAGNYQIEPDAYRERGYSGYVEYAAWEKGAIGVSSLLTFAGDDRLNPVGEDTTRQAHGVFGRMAFGELAVLMVEADVLLRSRRDMGYVGFAQLDVEPIRGLHFIGTGEVLDAGKPNDADSSVPGSGEAKFGGWLSAQWFFASHFDVRVDGIVRQEEPFQLLGQLHVLPLRSSCRSEPRKPFTRCSVRSSLWVLGGGRTGAASPTYPEAIAEHLDPPCSPQCTLCYRDNVGGCSRPSTSPSASATMDLGNALRDSPADPRDPRRAESGGHRQRRRRRRRRRGARELRRSERRRRSLGGREVRLLQPGRRRSAERRGRRGGGRLAVAVASAPAATSSWCAPRVEHSSDQKTSAVTWNECHRVIDPWTLSLMHGAAGNA